MAPMEHRAGCSMYATGYEISMVTLKLSMNCLVFISFPLPIKSSWMFNVNLK